MKVVLLENIKKIGSIGEIIDVKRGFARNFLIANKKALFASKENIAQVEKLKTLVAEVEFNDEETFAKKVATVKESYFDKTKKIAESADFDAVDDDENTVEVAGSMAQYITALNRTSKN